MTIFLKIFLKLSNQKFIVISQSIIIKYDQEFDYN